MTNFRPRKLPPNITEDAFQRFATKVINICGSENVKIISATLELIDGDYMQSCKAHASAIISPRNVPEVQDTVRLCNKLCVPLWPFSAGRNIGYGGTAPRVSVSVRMDMGLHMNKVLNVSVEGSYTLVEPGVTYFELHDYLEEHKLRVPDVGGGSIIGNAVERGVGYSKHQDHGIMHCGLEVILPDGELLLAALQLWLWPYNDGIFTQSSLGIVVKMGIWLMPNPGGFQAYMITFPRDDDLPKITDTIRPLRLQMVLQNVLTLRHITLDAAVANNKASYTDRKEPWNGDELYAIAQKLDLGYWNSFGAVYGPEPTRKVLLEFIKGVPLAIPGSEFWLPEDRTEPFSVLHTRAKVLQGIPTTNELSHLFFSPISKITGKDATAQYDLSKKRCFEAGFDFNGNFVVGMRAMHHSVWNVFNREGPEARKKARWLILTLVDDCAARGWAEYRTHIPLMDQIANTQNFNDTAQMKLNEKIKNAVDPNGILAPGKNGIWPNKYKKKGWVLDAASNMNNEVSK
ncbi:vanillyl alcohol oxidase [Microthyrium microscopicum]|uniref:Vanillyl alcohol oxidase n=1 Tax=Microthyrium microscopicum TaxID=703497 RepID=A0A6A6URR8_9PEZI|nr:vanillyl alcohol oxidase [Microthyrium microscopicum]